MLTDDHSRLEALDSYDILHSAQEKLFDDLVALAAYIFSVPIARIAFVHQQEVWHKASVGMEAQQVLPLEQSLCPRAITAAEPVLVCNHLLPTDAYNTEAMRKLKVQFYAGAPIRTRQGQCLGTMCLAAYEPREFTEAEQQLLLQLADLVILALEARRQVLGSADAAGWEQLRREAEETLHNQMAVVRYLKARSAGQVPVPDELLEPIAKRLQEVADVLRILPE